MGSWSFVILKQPLKSFPFRDVPSTGPPAEDKFRDFRSRPVDGGHQPVRFQRHQPGGSGGFGDEYFDFRRGQREIICTEGVPAAWGTSPQRLVWSVTVPLDYSQLRLSVSTTMISNAY